MRSVQPRNTVNSPPAHSTAQSTFSRSGLHCFYTNADSLRNKINDLQARIEAEKPDIIAITEVLPKNSPEPLQDCEFQIPGYNGLYHLSDGRGLALYTKNSLSATSVSFNNNFTESIWCRVNLRHHDSLLVGCVYRSPNSPTAKKHCK